MRGDDDAALLVGLRREDRRDEVTEGLADAGARFDYPNPEYR